ncbi:MAG: EF-hand domain-containing protein [Lamprobacter sp.]|uniref:EF-hand domain-containing protein n=1 Tax=Lamprobacter sp. TaxID=3100796 RepID=UPI002B256FF2|nr:EF-hand domain-containing protein [Lamprobacter sp.]MEA3641404.1 EF-hand domain-containing protein [Lamprobacter sp.]
MNPGFARASQDHYSVADSAQRWRSPDASQSPGPSALLAEISTLVYHIRSQIMQRVASILVIAIAGTFITSLSIAQDEAAAPTTPAEAFIQQLDTDGDGKVSLDEALAPQKPRFTETDGDGDGFISKEEASTAFNNQVPAEMLEAMKERGMPDPGETFVKNLDKDGDGKVSPAEFEQPTVDSFKRMDADSDGFATKDEAMAFFEEMQRQMQEQMQQMQQQQEQQ